MGAPPSVSQERTETDFGARLRPRRDARRESVRNAIPLRGTGLDELVLANGKVEYSYREEGP